MNIEQAVTDWKNGQCVGAREQLESTSDPEQAKAVALLCISLTLHGILSELTTIREKMEERSG